MRWAIILRPGGFRQVVDFPEAALYVRAMGPLAGLALRRPGRGFRPHLVASETAAMARPVTLFTGQWADMTLETICQKASSWGYDGIELPCWGDHFNVQQALKEPGYCQGRKDLLAKYGLKCWAISNHLVGQAVCDLIDERHKVILPEHVWGDGKAEGVHKRAAQEMMDTARAAAKLGVSDRQRIHRQFDLAPALLVSAGVGRDDLGGLSGSGRPMESDSRCVQEGRRAVWAGSPPDRDRV